MLFLILLRAGKTCNLVALERVTGRWKGDPDAELREQAGCRTFVSSSQ